MFGYGAQVFGNHTSLFLHMFSPFFVQQVRVDTIGYRTSCSSQPMLMIAAIFNSHPMLIIAVKIETSQLLLNIEVIHGSSPNLSERDDAGNIYTPSGVAGTCLGGARYAGFEPLGRPRPREFFADTRTKYGSPVSSSVIVYQSEEEFAAPPSLMDTEEPVAGMVTASRVDGLRPRTELPKFAV